MDKRSESLHQRLESIVAEMLERGLTVKDAVREMESIFFEHAGRKFRGNKTRMAEALGIHRNTLLNRAKALRPRKKGWQSK